MTLKQIAERRSSLIEKAEAMSAELDELAPKKDDGSIERFRRVNKGLARIFAEVDQLNDEEKKAKQARIRVAMQNPANIIPGDGNVRAANYAELDRDPFRDSRDTTPVYTGNDPWDSLEQGVLGRHTSVDEARSRALSAVELASGMTDASREKSTSILEDQDPDGIISRYCLTTSDPDYLSAFRETLRSPNPMLTDVEIRAVRRVGEFARAMSLTDTAGGFLVPFQLDPAVIQTDALGVSDIRRISKKVVATGDIWNGVSSGAVSWSWDAEASEVSDDATTFAQPAITIHTARGFVPISIEALMDEQNVTQAVSSLLVDGRDDLEGTALATGSGSGQPFGVVVALTGGASEVASAAADTFALADVNALWDALPARYQDSATWLASGVIYNEIRAFGAAGSPAPFITELAEERLIKRPMSTSSYLDSTYGSGENYILIVGDFSNYVIADRIGMSIELVPHLFATGANRPSGQRGFYAFFRSGADVVNDDSLRLLNVT